MALVPIPVPGAYPNVARIVSGKLERRWFTETRELLKLPRPYSNLKACDFTVGLNLLVIAAGLSKTLFAQGPERDRWKFEHFLLEFYPWDLDKPPLTQTERQEAVSAMYASYRNSLVHELGLSSKTDRHREIKLHRMRRERSNRPGVQTGLPEAVIRQLELAEEWPFRQSQRTLEMRPDALVLHCERFYFGLRHSVKALLKDKVRMERAERHLAELAAG